MAGADVNAAAAVADPSSMCQPLRRKDTGYYVIARPSI